jgi:solute carrier family 25 (mitochondrial 2-oxodicarboxylate transporter), member 21
MHPLDVVKTRFQVQGFSKDPSKFAADPFKYTSVADCFRKMIRHEGVGSFYKGIVPPILAETPKRALKFVSFEQYKKLLAPEGDAAKITNQGLFFAGAAAGATEAVIVNPFECVKVKMQSDKKKGVEVSSGSREVAASWTAHARCRRAPPHKLLGRLFAKAALV